MAEWVTLRCMSSFLALYTLLVVICIGYYFTGPVLIAVHRNNDHTPPNNDFKHSNASLSPDQSHLSLHHVSTDRNTSTSKPNMVSEIANGTTLTSQSNTVLQITNHSNSTKLSSEDGKTVGDFQPVQGGALFVYSAYYGLPNRPPGVTIVAIVNRTAVSLPGLSPITCVMGEDGSTGGVGGGGGAETSTTTTVTAQLTIIPDHHGHVFSPAFITCPVTQSLTLTSSSRLSVSVSTVGDQSVTNALPVHMPRPRHYRFLVCFSPLIRRYGDVGQLVQNLEMAQVLGAQHAVVYNSSITPRLDTALRYYVQSGFLDVKSWSQPPEPVHYKAQLAAINDCLLDNSHRSDFIVFMDFDEMIVPRVHESWDSLVRTVLSESSPDHFVHVSNNVLKMTESFISRISNKTINPTPVEKKNMSSHSTAIGALAFPSRVFLMDTLSNLTAYDLQFAQRYHASFLLKQSKTVQLWERRSKNMVDPRTVSIMGIHRVSAFLSGHKTLLVNDSVALLQHYRWYSRVPRVKDTSLIRFAPQLVQRMKNTFQRLAERGLA